MRISARCAASPETLYGVLADLHTHLDWGGSAQVPGFRLLSLEAGRGPAGVGTTFSSTGSIPMSGRRWSDRSTVEVAEPGRTFQFLTDASAGAMTARYRHRYDIAAEAGGCRVTHTMTQLAIDRPMLRLALPVMRQMSWGFAIPAFAGRGLRNLVRRAEQRAAAPPARPTVTAES